MAKRTIPKEIRKLASDYGKLIKERGIKADRLLVFGSYAKNLYRPSSDIDICIVSKDIKDEYAMQVELSKLTYDFDTRIQPHPVSLSDYLKNANPFISEIRRTGIAI